MQPRCRLQTHLCLNTQSTSFLSSLPSSSSFVLSFSISLTLSSSAGTSMLVRLCSETNVCKRVFMRDARTPRVTRAIYACACDDVGTRSEIYKRETHTHLSVVGDILFCPWSASRATDEYRQVLACSLSFFPPCLMESSRFVFC